MADAGGDNTSLQFTPTWEVALVCFIIVCISIIAEKFFHRLGQRLEKKIERPHLGAIRKIKDAMMAELMLLGFISLLLAVFQSRIAKICVSKQLSNIWLPCKKPDSSSSVANFTTSSFPSSGTQGRRLLAVASNTTDYCSQKGKVAFLSVEAVHHLHIFIFALAIIHVVLCVFKVLSMIIQWEFLKIYEARIKDNYSEALSKFKQSYESTSGFFVSMSLLMLKWIALMSPGEYIAFRSNFMAVRDMKATGEIFPEDIMRTSQQELEKMIGISWYLWLFTVIFLLMNVAGWHALFWISFIPLILLLVVHFKLERRITQLVKAVAEEIGQSEEESSNKCAILDSDCLFGRPRLVGVLIHFVLFENSLQLTFFFFILFQFGFHSCIMGKVGFVVPRIVIGIFVQLLCTCRTIPLYAIMKSQEKPLDRQKIERIMMLLKENQSDEHINNCLHDLDEIKMHLKKSDQQDIEKVKMLLKENESERIKKCLRDLNEIKKRLEEDEMDEEEEMWIVSCILNLIEGILNWIYKGISKWIYKGISKWIDIAISKWIDRGNKPSSPEEARNIEPTGTGSREGSVGVEITESTDMNSAGDIEAQNRQPRPHQHSK